MRPRSPLTTTCGRSPSPTGRGETRGRSGSTRKTPQWKCENVFYTKYLVTWVFQKNWTRFLSAPLPTARPGPKWTSTRYTTNIFLQKINKICAKSWVMTILAGLLPRQLPPFRLVFPRLPAWGGRGPRGGANGLRQDGNNQRRIQVQKTKSKKKYLWDVYFFKK